MGLNVGVVIVITSSFYICLMCFTPIDYGELCGEGINSGICKLFSECPSGIQQVIQKQTHNLQRCGFQRDEEILCCPDFKNESQKKNKTTKSVVWDVYEPTKPRESSVDRKQLADKLCGEVANFDICKIVTECPTEWNTENPSCGFLDNGTEMICCSDIKNDTLTNNNENGIPILEKIMNFLTAIIPTPIPRDSNGHRKSKAACREYIRYTSINLANRIIAGSDARIGEFPHMAQIGYQNTVFTNLYNWECGASLIHPRFVLTAAHCVERADDNPPRIVRFGFIDVYLPNGTNVMERLVQNYTVHPNYQRISKKNDIALIKLSDEALQTDIVYPACLYQKNDDPSNLIITGWGVTLSGNDSRILQKANLKPIDVENCSTIYATKLMNISITSNQICCLINNSVIDTCQGDSGGPLQTVISEIKNLYTIVGVTSYGVGCGNGEIPGVYTRVSSYIGWIESIVWP